jgi:hypothetical protein
LFRISFAFEVASVLCFNNHAPQRGQPFLHDFSDTIPNRSWPAIKFCGDGSEKAATAENSILNMTQPEVAKFPKARKSGRLVQRGLNDFVNEDRSRGLHRCDLQFFLGTKVSKESTLTK